MFPCEACMEGGKRKVHTPTPRTPCREGGPGTEIEKEEPEKSKKLQAGGVRGVNRGEPVGESQEHM